MNRKIESIGRLMVSSGLISLTIAWNINKIDWVIWTIFSLILVAWTFNDVSGGVDE